MTLDLFGPRVDVTNQLAEQFERMPPVDRMWLDVLLEAGATCVALEDVTAERERLHAASRVGLRWEWKLRVRGQRRAWYRPAHSNENAYGRSIGGELYTWLNYEPRLERQFGGGKQTEHQSGVRRHW